MGREKQTIVETPPPTEKIIRSLATPESFKRGREYFRNGAVSALVKRGADLVADVEGSEVDPYEVTITLHDSGVANARCTCRYDLGGYCKHIVATLLKFADSPEAVAERPSLPELLGELGHADLVSLIMKRAETDRGLAKWIEAELATTLASPGSSSSSSGQRRTLVDPEPVRVQAHLLLAGRYRKRRYWDDYHSSGSIEELQRLVERAVPFLEAGDGRNALRILEAVTETFVEDWLQYSFGSDENMYELFADLGRMIAEAALMSDLDLGERDDLGDTLDDWQSRLDEYGVDDGFGVAISALRSGWDEPSLLAVLAGSVTTWLPSGPTGPEDDRLTQVRLRVLEARGRTEEYLNLARAAHQHTCYAGMLAKLDRVAEAMAYARASFKAPGEALDLANVLRETGRHDEAIATAVAGLKLTAGQSDEADSTITLPAPSNSSPIALAHWLRDCAGPMGKTDIALSAARIAFEQSLTLEDYRGVESWAGNDWSLVRNELLAHLASVPHAHDRTEICLSEGLIDDAVRSVGDVDDYRTTDRVLMRLAETAHASHPDWVIRTTERKAARIMDANDARHYDIAAQWLQRAALAYDASGRIDEWATTIAMLIEKHRRKYKLRPLLERLQGGLRNRHRP